MSGSTTVAVHQSSTTLAVGESSTVVVTRTSTRIVGSDNAGPQGTPGLTAYEVAVAGGFVGDETAWLASLVGTPGAAATVAVGAVTTGVPGSSATVTNTGTTSAAVLDFAIPRGAPGADGLDGLDGDAATVAVGTVSTGAPGSPATVTNVGTNVAAVLDFAIPRGATGAAGADGLDGTDGTNGAGVAPGGAAGQVLAKIDAVDYNTEWVDQSTGTSATGGAADPILATAVQWLWVTDGTFDGTYADGPGSPAGVGATWTGLSDIATWTVDGITTALTVGSLCGNMGRAVQVGDRVLVSSSGAAQGAYTVTQLNPWVLTRATDMDDAADSALDFLVPLANCEFVAQTARYGGDNFHVSIAVDDGPYYGFAIGIPGAAAGAGALASRSDTIAHGQGSRASASQATAVGSSATATGFVASAYGNQAAASGFGATAVGWSAIASNVSATAIGQGAQATAAGATAVGAGVIVTTSATVVGSPAAGAVIIPAIVDQSADYTPGLSDAGTIQRVDTTAAAVAVTLPAAAATAYTVGTELTIVNIGANALALVADAGATVQALNGSTLTGIPQWGQRRARLVAADTWYVSDPGASGATSTTVDFGTSPVESATFTITDARVTTGTIVHAWPHGSTASGRTDGDEEWDNLTCTARSGTGSFTLTVHCTTGSLVGNRVIAYTIQPSD